MDGHGVELFLLIGGQERFDFGLDVFHHLLPVLALVFLVFLRLGDRRIDDGLDFRFFIIGQGKPVREAIEHGVGHFGGIRRPILSAAHAHHSAAEVGTAGTPAEISTSRPVIVLVHGASLAAAAKSAAIPAIGASPALILVESAAEVLKVVSEAPLAVREMPSLRTAATAKPMVFVVMVDDAAHHDQEQNKSVQRQADDGQGP